MRKSLAAMACASLFATFSFAAPTPAPVDTMPRPLARTVAHKVVDLVEKNGLYPRREADYVEAKAGLLAVVDDGSDDVDRRALYAHVGTLLKTLDADGHSFVMLPARQQQGTRAGMAPDGVLRPPAFRLVTTSLGTVLRWTPPPVAPDPKGRKNNFLTDFYDEAAARPDLAQACALVVDLTEQTGGNAWPPFIAMYPLFGTANKANWVDRDGKRIPYVDRASLEAMARPDAAGRANPLAPYATGPLAVLVGSRTASAGEMLLVALLGEDRVQTFGQTSFGMTTANKMYALDDGATLVLSERRYALGDGPVYRGGIPAMHPIEPDEPIDHAAQHAAEWAAAHSPRCTGGQRQGI
jgi:hypothetical protein